MRSGSVMSLVMAVLVGGLLSQPRVARAEDDPCTTWWIIGAESCIGTVLCIRTTTSSQWDCASVLEISEQECNDQEKVCFVDVETQNVDKRELSGNLSYEAFGVSASQMQEEIENVSCEQSNTICDGDEGCEDCCEAAWFEATKTCKYKEGWCEWLPPCDPAYDPEGDDIECQGSACLTVRGETLNCGGCPDEDHCDDFPPANWPE